MNHCFTTCTGRTSRTSCVKPFTGRICSTILDKDRGASLHILSDPIVIVVSKDFQSFIPLLVEKYSWKRTVRDETVDVSVLG